MAMALSLLPRGRRGIIQEYGGSGGEQVQVRGERFLRQLPSAKRQAPSAKVSRVEDEHGRTSPLLGRPERESIRPGGV